MLIRRYRSEAAANSPGPEQRTKPRRGCISTQSLRGLRGCCWLYRRRSRVMAAFDPSKQAVIRTALLAAVGRRRLDLPPVNRRPLHPVMRSMSRSLVIVVGLDRDGDLFRDQRRGERHMITVAQHQLQGVFSRRQVEQHLGLAATEMQML